VLPPPSPLRCRSAQLQMQHPPAGVTVPLEHTPANGDAHSEQRMGGGVPTPETAHIAPALWHCSESPQLGT